MTVGITLFPLMFLIALAIKLDSRGPVFFVQRRVGRDRELFPMVKFRTMIDRRAEEIDQVKEAPLQGDRDPRITRVGRFLRKTSLDEVPQLWNILRGEMSLVGPRPLLPEQLPAVPSKFEDRFRVRPGVTGLAQVMGRQALDWPEKLRFDAEYARRPTLRGNLRILFRTAVMVFRREGIYYEAPDKNWRAYLPGDSP